jgi:hypothetical protein
MLNTLRLGMGDLYYVRALTKTYCGSAHNCVELSLALLVRMRLEKMIAELRTERANVDQAIVVLKANRSGARAET